VVRSHRTASENEIPVQSGKDSAEHCSGDEAARSWPAGIKWSAIVFVWMVKQVSNREKRLNGRGYSARNERRLLDTLGRGLLKEYPNPERSGCPGSDVLRRIASRKMALPEAEKWLDHLGSCSPCYRDFSQFQKAYQLRRKHTLLAIAASILVAASIGGWALVQKHNKTQITQTAVLDLRYWSVPRGVEPNPGVKPLEVNREASRLSILLPLGSSEGQYDVRIAKQSGESLVTAIGMAKLSKGVTALRVAMNLSSVSPDTYILQIRKAGLEWNSYPLDVH
jgi:hypothetical protein